ncbi:inositol monophosphatase family protein [Lactobacillus sp. YT155]|uniref:inositol monophosphatase family protein n=1 Tax=Lactobacillus sp. YT155 TaxID=3060955 RepID=UPI00265E7819|nr:inositol monophosphatase family protein [Lactobacillus sp. YT155]MDO1605302.1 inositol monophosphatase family protein [Lactobacillus sp. YT155]
MNIEKLANEIEWTLKEVAEKLKKSFSTELSIDTKSGKNDLVTNMDREIEQFIINHLKSIYPTAQFISEEGYGDTVTDLGKLTFFIDPIDGTLNYVKERKDFASMIGVYYEGKPVIGAIMNVMAGKIYIGGPELGVFCGKNKLMTIPNQGLDESLITVSSRLLLQGEPKMQEIIKKSSGLRMFGSAGIVFTRLIENRQSAYISHLKPWDLVAGKILTESLGMETKSIDESPINVLKSQSVIIGTKHLTQEVLNILN